MFYDFVVSNVNEKSGVPTSTVDSSFHAYVVSGASNLIDKGLSISFPPTHLCHHRFTNPSSSFWPAELQPSP